MPPKPGYPEWTDWTSPQESTIPDNWLQQVWGYLAQHPLPIPSGQIQGFRSTLVTGQVNSDGSVHSGGSRFTSAKTGTGTYTVTFSVAFDGAECAVGISPYTARIINLNGIPSTTGFSVTLEDHTGSAADSGFSFIAATVLS